jgi:hypothetical protein
LTKDCSKPSAYALQGGLFKKIMDSVLYTLVVAVLRAKLRLAATLDFPTPVSEKKCLMTTDITAPFHASNLFTLIVFYIMVHSFS